MLKGVCLDRATLMTSAALDKPVARAAEIDFSALGAVVSEWDWYDDSTADETAGRIADATVVVTNKVVLDRQTLLTVAQRGRLQLICVAATGTNNVDITTAQELGIAVCNVTGYATASVSEHVFALMLALARHLPEYQRAVSAGRWQQSRQFCLLDYPLAELHGRRLGIVGYGELGQAVARLAAAFDMDVIVAEWPGITSPCTQVPIARLVREADIITLHCPLTPATECLIAAEQFAAMQAHTLLINTARGGIVDEQALADALRSGQIAGAAIDVLSSEPPNSDHPLLQAGIPNLIITPHIAWASVAARQRLVDEVAENIRAWTTGRQRNRVC
jgi:glycerate dehydrogenase